MKRWAISMEEDLMQAVTTDRLLSALFSLLEH